MAPVTRRGVCCCLTGMLAAAGAGFSTATNLSVCSQHHLNQWDAAYQLFTSCDRSMHTPSLLHSP